MFWLGGALFSYAALCLLVSSQQAKLTFFPTFDLRITPKDLRMDFEEWVLASSDGAEIHAWAIPGQQNLWVLHCHGNGGNISHRLTIAKRLHNLGLGVVLFDYRGFGASRGQLNQESQLIQDGQVVYDRLAQLHAPIILYGESLGGGVASALAEKNNYAGLVLQSTFTRLEDRASEAYPFLPVRWLSRFPLRTLDRLPKLHGPVLVMHSPEDEVIGFHHGQRLFERAPEPKFWVELSGGHNDPDLDKLTGGVAQLQAFLLKQQTSRP